MKTIRLLVLGAGGNVSQGIIKAVRNYDFGVKVSLTGACVEVDSAGLFMCDRCTLSPYARDSGFLPWLIDYCNREAIDMVLTGVEEVITAVSEGFARFQEGTRALFIASDPEKLRIGQDKYLTCRWLEEHGCNYPAYCLTEDKEGIERLVSQAGYPLIVKPRTGKGSKGVYRIGKPEELSVLLGHRDYILQEYVGSPECEYTVGCYADRQGRCRDVIVMRRTLNAGTTQTAEVVKDAAIEAEAAKICAAFAPKGPLNIQMRKRADGTPVCFEMNVRFSGTAPMRAHFGYQDVAALIKEYLLGEEIDDCFHISEGFACRYVNELYLTGSPIPKFSSGKATEDLSSYGFAIERMDGNNG